MPERRVYVKDNGDVIFHVYEKRKYSSIAQLAEHMTVNHRVAGSSPAGGAKNPYTIVYGFLLINNNCIL